jgi:hypothetical protein
MTKSRTFVSSLLILTLCIPTLALAQASRRGGGESGGDGGGRTSSEPSVGTAQPRVSQPSSSPAPAPSRPSGREGSSSPASVRSTAARNPGGGSVDRPGTSQGSRVRDSRLARGSAQPRGNLPIRVRPEINVYSYPGYWSGYPYGYWYSGFYDPWYFGSNRWGWGMGYSGWHRPYLYDPYGYYGPWPYYWGGSPYAGGSDDQDDDVDDETGALRLRVSPKDAKVYVGGALAGTVDEFDGLTDHLRLPAGKHQIELRADGFEPATFEVEIKKGKTRTERLTLRVR